MSKFGSWTPKSQTHVEYIISPHTGAVLKDKNGKASFIEVYSSDSKIGLDFDHELRSAQKRQMRVGDFEPTDDLVTNLEKCAALTKDWYLVDPATLAPLDIPCTRENALEFYRDHSKAAFLQAWLAANRPANFMERPSNGSADTASQSGEKAAS